MVAQKMNTTIATMNEGIDYLVAIQRWAGHSSVPAPSLLTITGRWLQALEAIDLSDFFLVSHRTWAFMLTVSAPSLLRRTGRWLQVFIAFGSDKFTRFISGELSDGEHSSTCHTVFSNPNFESTSTRSIDCFTSWRWIIQDAYKGYKLCSTPSTYPILKEI